MAGPSAVTKTCNLLLNTVDVCRQCIAAFPQQIELHDAEDRVKELQHTIQQHLDTAKDPVSTKKTPGWCITTLCTLLEFCSLLQATLTNRKTEMMTSLKCHSNIKLHLDAARVKVTKLEHSLRFCMSVVDQRTAVYKDDDASKVNVRILLAELNAVDFSHFLALEELLHRQIVSIDENVDVAKKLKRDRTGDDIRHKDVVNVRLTREKIELEHALEKQKSLSDQLIDVIFNSAVAAAMPGCPPSEAAIRIETLPPHKQLQAWHHLMFKSFEVISPYAAQVAALKPANDTDIKKLRHLVNVSLHPDKQIRPSEFQQWNRLLGLAHTACVTSLKRWG